MISKDEVIEMANRAKYDPVLGFGGGYGNHIEVIEFSLVQLQRFANSCYKQGIEDAENVAEGYSIAGSNAAYLIMRDIRKLGEAE